VITHYPEYVTDSVGVNRPSSVFIIDDDPDFVDLLCQILGADDDCWEVTATFSSIEDFNSSYPTDFGRAQELLPDLLIIDLFSSVVKNVHNTVTTGVHTAMVLRGFGLSFGTMIVSSLDSPSLLDSVRQEFPLGWSYVVKSTSLTSEKILQGAREALIP
jgi:hypothetical protein